MAQVTTVPDVGTAMPDLAVVDGAGARLTISAVRDGRPAVIFFLRAAGCAVCVRHARALTAMAADGELGGRALLLMVPGGADEAAELQRRLGSAVSAPVSVWASGDGHASAGLGTFLAVQHSGTFLVSASGAVVYRRTSLLPTGSFSATELRTALSR